MSVTITLHIYSGRPDPSWELTHEQSAELVDRIATIESTTLLKPSGLIGKLGYRGFSITSVRESKLDPLIYIQGGIVDLERFDLNRIAKTPELEEWLLSTADSSIIPDDVRDVVSGEISYQINEALARPIIAEFVPHFDPGKWNNDQNIRTKNNCYNYANDKITNSFAQPGLGSGLMYSSFDCGNVGPAAQRDGQIPVSPPSSTPAQGHYIALVIWPGNDFHWYRCDSNDKWSHKPGSTPARNTDNAGNLIQDPRNCDRGPYTNFCSFYLCIPTNTTIR